MKHSILIFIILLGHLTLSSQSNNVGIGTTSPNASAALEVSAADKGILIPRMSTTQREMISSPAEGLLVFDMTSNSFWYFSTAWTEIAQSGNGDNLGNHIATQNINMSNHKITNLSTPTANNDAANKSYVDSELIAVQINIDDNTADILTNSLNINTNAANIFNNTTAINTHISNDQDLNSTNEIQQLTISNDTVYLSDGGNVKLPKSSFFDTVPNSVLRYNDPNFNNFVFGHDALPVSGIDLSEELFFYSGFRGAFRSGSLINSPRWGLDSLGINSVAFGRNTLASGIFSFAAGNESRAPNRGSIAMGEYCNAEGYYATAIGQRLDANSYNNTVFGRFNVDTGDSDSWVETDPIFQIGNGTNLSNKSNALSILKNGTVSFENYTFPDADGTTDQVLKTDGSGNLSWSTPEAGGVFETNNTTVRYTGSDTHDFIFGHPSMPTNFTPIDANLMLFDEYKGAFRAGILSNSTNWGTDSIGLVSTAFGVNTLAKGEYSTAFGYQTEALNAGSVAFGYQTKSTGLNATVIGRGSKSIGQYSFASGYFASSVGYNSRAHGEQVTAQSYISNVFGRWNEDNGNSSAWVETDPLFQVGNGTNISNKSNAFTILKNGTVSFENYTFPDGDGTVDQVFKTDGNGNITWEDDKGVFEYNNGVVRNTGSILDDFVFGNDQLPLESEIFSGALILLDHGRKAFRAGGLSISDNWSPSNMGHGSIGIGHNALASGQYSIALGDNDATGQYSFAFGHHNEATASFAMALGTSCNATGTYSTAIGNKANADSYSSIALGFNNVGGGNGTTWIETDPLFEIGNGDFVTPSNALTIYKNGVAEFSDSLHTVGNLNVGNGIGSRIYLGNTMMQSGGPTILRMETNVRPYTDDTYDLGSSGKRWQDVWAANGVIQTSDRRLKKNIQPLDYGLEEVLSLQSVQYNWNKEDETTKKHLGLIAQDLLEVIPEVVSEEGEYLGVKYAELVPVLIKAIQDQQEIIKGQDEKIDQLLTQNNSTQASLDTILERLEKLESPLRNPSADE